MSGHSKWSTIKRKKGVKDAARGKLFSKLSRLISTAVREGGNIADPENNFKLRLAIERARSVNMPKETIDRAIEKGSAIQGDQTKEIIYEAFISDGITLLIEAITDNPNRTHSEVKKIIENAGGKMGSQNSVSYQYDHCGLIIIDKTSLSQEELLNLASRIQAIDIDEEEGSYLIYIPFKMLGKINEYLTGITKKSIEGYYRPKNIVDNVKESVFNLFETLEDLDDVARVFSNAG